MQLLYNTLLTKLLALAFANFLMTVSILCTSDRNYQSTEFCTT